ncbi:MAG: HIT family protein [Chloroflexi bacterium]|nr:HIT family protein [Chloroflexota bacterium]MDA1002353.1 HIT family protein [Chloroflexota bacterium]
MPDAEQCTFCRVVAGHEPAATVYADALVVVFLDRRPLFPGHCLLVPRTHVETLGDLPPDAVGPLFERVRRLSVAVERAMDAEGTFVAMNNRVSQSVPHLHVHVVPRRRRDGLRGFFWPRTTYDDGAHAERVRASIAGALEGADG